MLRWALLFLIIALIAGIFGFWGLEGLSMWIAKVLFVVFLILFIVSLVMGVGRHDLCIQWSHDLFRRSANYEGRLPEERPG